MCTPRLLSAQREFNSLVTISAVPAATIAVEPLVSPGLASFLSVSPAIAAQILFLSPMQAMRKFRADGTTGAVSALPYAAMAANGASWTTYGALGGDFTIMVPNFTGLVLGSYYCHQFYTLKAPDATVLPYFGGGAAFVSAVLGAAATLPVESAQTFIGYAGCSLTALMFMGPLTAIQTVLKDKSAASLPLAFTLASTANCSLWTAYGALVIHDPFVWGPNGCGLAFSFAQLGLIGTFGTGGAASSGASTSSAPPSRSGSSGPAGGGPPIKLSTAALTSLGAAGVVVPPYARDGVLATAPGIVHLGVGGFHRSHMAVYTCEALRQPEMVAEGWGICGVGMMPADVAMKDALGGQDGMYTVLSRGKNTSEARVCGAITKFLHAPEDPAAVLAQMAAESTRIVSLTITEKGYCAADLGAMKLDVSHPFVQHDSSAPSLPKSGLGFVVAALARRRSDGLAPFTVLSCDNLQGNGTTARTLTLAMAEQMAPALGAAGEGLVAWIEESVRFPNAMVDRITPATTPEVKAAVAGFGIEDAWPVVGEDFAQWVIEDEFPLGRPKWENAAPLGAESAALLVDDVVPYELMKLRLLNGGHSSLAYLGYLLGHRTTDAAMADDDVFSFVRAYMAEVRPRVAAVPGVDLDAYQSRLVERFSNPAISDQIQRLCEDGSQKMNVFIAPPTRESTELGAPTPCAAFVTAMWIQYRSGVDCEGEPIQITDPGAAPSLQPLAAEAAAATDAATARAFVEEALGKTLAENDPFVEGVAASLSSLKANGPRTALQAFMSGLPK